MSIGVISPRIKDLFDEKASVDFFGIRRTITTGALLKAYCKIAELSNYLKYSLGSGHRFVIYVSLDSEHEGCFKYELRDLDMVHEPCFVICNIPLISHNSSVCKGVPVIQDVSETYDKSGVSRKQLVCSNCGTRTCGSGDPVSDWIRLATGIDLTGVHDD